MLKKGHSAEEEVINYLENKGYLLKERNFRFGRSEIDLIMQDGDCIVFIEVKLRSSDRFGYPEDFLTEAQKGRIRDAAVFYMEEKKYDGHIRFDLLAVLSNSSIHEITHFEDAF